MDITGGREKEDQQQFYLFIYSSSTWQQLHQVKKCFKQRPSQEYSEAYALSMSIHFTLKQIAEPFRYQCRMINRIINM